MRESVAFIGSLILLTGMVPYILDTVKGKTKPNVVSWFTWTLLTTIGTFAALSEGAITTAILSGASALATLSVTILGLKRGIKHYTFFDGVCQVAALVGVVLWQITKQPELAVAIVVATDIIASLPTQKHAWQEPFAETWQAFAAGAIGSGMALATVTQFTFVALAYPTWLALANFITVGIIAYRRPKLKLKVVE